jgi:hypothetical protein
MNHDTSSLRKSLLARSVSPTRPGPPTSLPALTPAVDGTSLSGTRHSLFRLSIAFAPLTESLGGKSSGIHTVVVALTAAGSEPPDSGEHHRPKGSLIMKRELYSNAKYAALLCVVLFVECSQAATVGTQIAVSPMPFTAGQPIAIKANFAGPFTNANALVSVTDGAVVVHAWTVNVGAAPSGQNAFTTPWTPPSDLHAKSLQVSVVFVEGAEKYVGEPVPGNQLKLAARCPRGGKTARPCRYATGRHWLQTTKVTGP